jgi:tetratricopeptide (TPR) repeat protein
MLRTSESLALAQKAFELDPRSSVISVNLANHYLFRGLFSLAERQYLQVIELDPDFVGAYTGLADLYMGDLSQFDKALALYRKASQLDPGNPFNLLKQLELYQQLGDVAAMEGIRNAIAAAMGEGFWMVGSADVWLGLARNDVDGTRESLNLLLPRIEKIQYIKVLAGPIALLLGNKGRARELFVDANPGWLDPEQWDRLIQENHYPCIYSWILINTGDEELGNDLLRQTTAFHEETLPAVFEHADDLVPDICYLTGGDNEKALNSIETQLEHGHLYRRDLVYRFPMYDQIRDEPRFLAVVEERERRIAIQREAVAQMNAKQSPVPSG